MIDNLRLVSTEPVPCKICGGAAPLYGVVDFNRNREIPNGVKLALSGTPIYYRRCAQCKFLFTDAFDDWSIEQFKTHIYNDDYELVDADYRSLRPRANADVVARLWGAIKAKRASSIMGAATTYLHRASKRWFLDSGNLRPDGARTCNAPRG